MGIHKQEEKFLKKLEEHFEMYGELDKLCKDGLCYNGELYNNDWNTRSGNEEELWSKSNRRVLFLMKDPNSNPGEDYREWGWASFRHSTFKIMFAWLKGLSLVTAKKYPSLEEAYQQYDVQYPLAIVNIKKASGGSSVSNNKVWEYAKRDSLLLKEQVREILHPNIIVCTGESGTVLAVAKTFIYDDIEFEKVNEWCYYNAEKNILLIDSWHPAAIISLEQKYDNMMKNVQDFISKHPKLFK
ncbi:hypothetical protein ACPDHN_16270 [Myroides odoratimimus]|uniref:hypothetical protein n=1 Tax=Myroides odoratimimus TaxID=76832 RepID=UPI003D2F9B01